jgi:hypothetical protein
MSAAKNAVAAPIATAHEGAIAKDVATATAQLITLKRDFDALVTRYDAYRTTDDEATMRLGALSHLAAEATLDSLDAVESQIQGFQEEEDQKVFALLDDVPELRAKIHAVTTELDKTLGRFGDLGAAGTWQRQAIRSLNDMLEYCEGRRERSDLGVLALINGTHARREALVASAKAAAAGTAEKTSGN